MEQRRDVAHKLGVCECVWTQIHHTAEDRTLQSAQRANTDPPAVRIYGLNSH